MLTQYNNLFEKAIIYWGKDAQLNMVSEENCELNLLLEKYERHGMDHILSRVKKNYDGSESIEHISIKDWLTEECADGLIMLSQLALILGTGDVWNEIRKKADRLRDRLYELDHTRKEICCNGCKGVFEHNAEINSGLICKLCGEPLFKVGFNWIRIYDSSQGFTKDEDCGKSPFKKYQEKIYPSDDSIPSDDDIEKAIYEYLQERYEGMCGACCKRQLSTGDPFSAKSKCHYDGEEVTLDAKCRFEPTRFKMKEVDE